MGLIDVRDVEKVDRRSTELCSLQYDDEVFVDSDYDDVDELQSSVSSAASSTSSDYDEWTTAEDQSSTITTTRMIRGDDGAELCRVRLGRQLGTGGFGRVYDAQLECAVGRRRVAVKMPRCSGETSTSDSFLAESALVRLRHANLVSVLATGWTCARHPDDRCDDNENPMVDRIPAIVMEFAGHRSLQSVIDNCPHTLGLRRRVNYGHDVSAALSYIHRRGLVHLDLKPANIIVTESDRCKLTDFGCSQRLPSACRDDDDTVRRSVAVQRSGGSQSSRRRGSPTLSGTFAYRAPELFRGAAVSPAADVYSLGVTLWQLRSQVSSPYAGRDGHAVIFAVVAYHDRPDTSPAQRRRRSVTVPRPSSVVSDVSPARTPDRRYRNVFRSCWEASPAARPTAAQLVRLFTTWRTELDSVSSTSSLDADDTDDI